MKKYILLLLILFAVTACESMTVEEKLTEQVVEEAIAFDFDGVGSPLPEELLQKLAGYQMVIVGEYHGVLEHAEFLGTLMVELHKEGFRVYLAEMDTLDAQICNEYIHGEDILLPQRVMDSERIVIEYLAEWNRALRESDRASEQIRFAGFDVSIFSNFQASMANLARIYGLGLQMHSPEKWIELLETDALAGIESRQKDTLIRLAKGYKTSKEIRNDPIREFRYAREDLIEEQVLAVLDTLEPGEKALMDTGMVHAELRNHYWRETMPDLRPFASRLKTTLGDEMFSFAMIPLGYVVELYETKEIFIFQLQEDESERDITTALVQNYPDQMIFADLTGIKDTTTPMRVQLADTVLDEPLNELFNGYLIYPEVTHDPSGRYYVDPERIKEE